MQPTSRNLGSRHTASASPADPKLSPKLERARAKSLSALGNLSLIDALAQLKSMFLAQKTEDGRLANLAAQTWILRRRLEALQKGQPLTNLESLLEPAPDASLKFKLLALTSAAPTSLPNEAPDDTAIAPNPQDQAPKFWQKVRILSEAEVHGMVFFEGSTIAVEPEDALRLLSAGKAEIVEEVIAKPSAAPVSEAKTKKPRSGGKAGGSATDKATGPKKQR
jgi:hypothetical protein